MTTSRSTRAFLPRIEALRGIAAVLVGCYHIGQMTFGEHLEGWQLAYMGVANGIGCVVAFFVISGFVLARSLDRRIGGGGPWLLDYFRARIFRLFPAVVVVVALIAALHRLFGVTPYLGASYSVADILQNMLLIRTDIDRVMWSMKVELVATPLIVICVLIAKRRDPAPLLYLIMLLFGFSFFGQYCGLLGDGSNLGPLYAFVFGILVHFHGQRLSRKVSTTHAAMLAVFAILTFCMCGALKVTAIQVMVECLSAAALIFVVVFWPETKLFKPLDHPVVHFYGRISYSFYLVHPLSIWLVAHLQWSQAAIAAGYGDVPVAIVTAFVSVVIATPLAYLCWRFVELPGVALGRSFGRRQAVPACR